MHNNEEKVFRESERRLIQKELFLLEDQKDAAEQRFRMMFENALVGLFRADVLTEELSDVNLEAARIFGFDNAEDAIAWVKNDFEAFSFFSAIPGPRSLDIGKPYSFSARSRRRDGSEFWAQFSVRYTADGLWLEGAVKDITDQVESMERLRQAKAEAEEASEAKSRFLATMSHEIRTPLNGIIGYAEILQDRDDPKAREYSRKILDESDRLMILINQLLDISRLEANKITLETIPFNLYQLIDEIDESFARAFERNGLLYERNIDSDLPRWYIGDPMRLRQVLTNLLSNALKFTREGAIFLTIDMVGEAAASPLVRFSVKDTGIGIAPDKQESIFSSFVQADTSISRRYGGTGLGVSICRELVYLMGGELDLESAEGEGAEFHFTVAMPLPLESVDAVPAYRDRPLSRLDALEGRNVLIVEDYETNREIARHHLEKAGCRVFFAEDGLEAVEMLTSGEVMDIIFMDMHMPRMDGLEATAKLRESGIDTPIIGMTASAYAEDRARCLVAGMDDFLTKPIRRAGLLLKAADWITTGGLARDKGSDSTGPVSALSGDSPLRYNDFLDELGGEADLVRELLDGYVDDSRTRIGKMDAALAMGDYVTLHREIHSIKGGALNVMADELAGRALEAESLARDETPSVQMQEALDKVQEAYNRFVAEWKGTREKNDARERQPGSL